MLTVETPLISHIVHQQYAHSTSIICRRDRPKPLLASCIPYLQLHSLAIKLNCANLKVNADSGDKGRSEGVFAKAEQAAGFADTRIAYEEKFDLTERSG